MVQLKKMQKLLPAVFLVTAVSCVVLGVLLIGFFRESKNQEGKKNYSVAIVGNMDESYLGFGVQAVQSLDDSRYVVDFVFMTESEAKKAFAADKVTGIIIIPDGLVDSLVYGRNDVKIKYIVSDGQKGITNILMEEFAAIASTLITRSQAGVFGMQHVMYERGMYDIFDRATDELNLKYISLVLSRTEICGVEELGVTNGLPMTTYIACGILVFVLLLLGITYSPIFAGRQLGLNRVFKSKGVGEGIQVMGEYLSYFLMVLICTLGLGLLAFLFLTIGDYEIQLLEDPLLVTTCLKIAVPVIALITAMQFFFYEIVDGVVSSVLIQFVLGVGMCYISGCFYPAGFFPEAVQAVGSILPTGVIMKYLAGCLLEDILPITVVGMLLYWVAFGGLSVMVRAYKLRKG